MTSGNLQPGDTACLQRADLDCLLQELKRAGYTVVGPVVRDQAIVYDRIESAEELPAGWTEVQEGGTYRLERRQDAAVFGFTVGPDSWKKFLNPPRTRLVEITRTADSFETRTPPAPTERYAFLGARACELQAIAIQDRVFINDTFTDPGYQARREQVFIVAVNCTQAASTCFCVSMNSGPRAAAGFDLALTEVLEENAHYFLVEVGTGAGAELFSGIPHRKASPEQRARARERVERTARSMGRQMETDGIKELLYDNLEHPRWAEVAGRCLTCANCTLVCPTCFCSTVEEVTDLTGDHAERWRRWDSCFTMDFSYIHGGHVRASTRSRYRQWLTHKLASWQDQFGTSGCVGCGRCITWCPVGIDLTEEVRAFRGPVKNS